ncbi:MAG TPA: nucleotidyl transferase AbiEii/AbiGii toxin family protein, partial [Thermoanaerobaculia bacterium]|nr:nucleotidyl transferase AbiEii/AbiGii toxin family protein [Thermoanaerobaculia bacterium]
MGEAAQALEMTADLAFHDALRAVADALRDLAAPSMIIGGVAVIAAGVPRETIDVDATILGEETDLDTVLSVLLAHAIVPRIADARQFAREHQVLLLRHQSSGVTVEISFAWLPFERDALEHALELEIEGIRLRVARPEDLIIYKAAAWRDRDRSDIERLLVL